MDVNSLVEEINLHKSKIAFYVASVFSGFINDEDKLMELFADFDEEIRKSNVYIIKKLSYETLYETEIRKDLKELEKILGYNVSAYALNMFTSLMDPYKNFNKENYTHLNEDEIDRIYNLYVKDLPFYWNIGLWCDKFFEYMLNHSEDEYLKLIDLIKKNNRKIVKYYKDNNHAYFKEKFLSSFNISRFSRFVNKYKLKDVNDLMNLLTEVNSFIIDVNCLDEKEIIQVEMNKAKYRIRMNKSNNYCLSVKEASKLKEKIEKIINDNLFSNVFIDSNLGDFFKFYDIEFNKKNINNMIDLYFRMINTDGVNFYHDFGKGVENFSLYNENAFTYGDMYKWNVIIHEFIHCLERTYSYGYDNSCFSIGNRLLNEVLTEYLARESTRKFFNFKEYVRQDVDEKYNSVVDLMEVIAESSVFKYFVKAKLYDDNKGLLKMIGKKSLDRINECFYNVWDKSDSCKDAYFDIIKKKLKQEIVDIENRITSNNNKKSKI